MDLSLKSPKWAGSDNAEWDCEGWPGSHNDQNITEGFTGMAVLKAGSAPLPQEWGPNPLLNLTRSLLSS